MKMYQTPKLPLDEDGYTLSFDVKNCYKKNLQQFYHKFGLIIFKNVLSQQQVQKSIDALWQELKLLSKGAIQREKGESFSGGMLKAYGFVNNCPSKHIQLWRNRQNKNVYNCFKLGYQVQSKSQLTQPMWAMFDRGSVLRPGKNNPDWVTSDIYHFDLDPWKWTNVVPQQEDRGWRQEHHFEARFFQKWLGQGNSTPKVKHTKLQGVLALSDTNDQSGGFETACGFQNYIRQWCERNAPTTDITQDKQLLQAFQRVFMRKGSLLIFSRELPHNIYPNISDRFRYAQYLRMSPMSCFQLTQKEYEQRRHCLKTMIPKQLQITDVAKEIYMMGKMQGSKNGKKCQIM